ncbi:MAG: hypothetical protein SH850_07930 [Planctomycetaceae bacterium]|nr:hypothetical protein [Planctomycetaceae bacterium]
MIQLTDSDFQTAAQGHPVRLTDPSGQAEFFLVSAAHLERLNARGPVVAEVEAGYHILAGVSPDDWEDISNYEVNGDHASATR